MREETQFPYIKPPWLERDTRRIHESTPHFVETPRVFQSELLWSSLTVRMHILSTISKAIGKGAGLWTERYRSDS